MHGAVHEKIRGVSLLPTKYFDILFPNECAYSARLVAEHCDKLFESACETMRMERPFRIPVVFSPDSDKLSVLYTSAPYNRIVIYDAPPSQEAARYGETLLVQFKREVFRAVSLSIRSPFWHVASKIISDTVQPAYVLNMPFSFVEGACFTMEHECTLLDDARSLQLLSQAKLENKFPSWRQVTGARDIYPGKELAQAAGTAFAAYIQQRWGMERYVNFWHAAGSVHLFSFTAGIFQNVYSVPLKTAWNDFKDAVPLPADIDAMNNTSEKSAPLLKYAYDRVPKYLVSGKHGAIYYDQARSEVVLIDERKNIKRLFTATDVTRLSLSCDGAYMAVSFYAQTSRSNLQKQCVKIYDIEKREFLADEFSMYDGTILQLDNGKYVAVGLSGNGQRMELCAYSITDTKSKTPETIYSRSFAPNVVPYAPVALSSNTIACIVVSENERMLFATSLERTEETTWRFPYAVISMERNDNSLAFSYLCEERGALVRSGIVQLAEHGEVHNVLVQQGDIFGGAYYTALQENKLLYCAQLASCGEVRSVPLASLSYAQAELVKVQTAVPRFDDATVPVIEKRSVTGESGKIKTRKFLDDMQLATYNPLRYIFRGTWLPMLPVTNFSFENGYSLAPGLGVTYLTESDPFEAIKGVLSFATAFANPETNYQTFNKMFSLAGYVNTQVLPVDIAAGVSWRFTKHGAYTLQAIVGAKWNVPLGMSYHHLSFTLQQLWTAATSYTDPDTKITSEKPGWTSVSDAYRDNRFSLTASYSNYRKAGISAYEQLGFAAELTLLLDYDREKIAKTGGSIVNPTTVGFAANLGLKIPRLHPFSYVNNFVTGVPVTIYSQWFGKSGTSCNTYAELLLFGWESHIGIPVLNLYLTRFGLSAGYNFSLTYDTIQLPDPDIRKIGEYIDVLKGGTWNDYVYMTTKATFSPNIGFMTSIQITAALQYQYHIRENKFKLAASIKTNL